MMGTLHPGALTGKETAVTTDRPRGTVPDLDALKDYAERSDRQHALFFVGRKPEIAEVERLCAEALQAVRAGDARKGLTQVFQGAPGAGKSSLLSELERRWTAQGGNVPGTPLAVRLEWGDLLFEETVVRSILRCAAPELEETYRQTRTRDLPGRAGGLGVTIGGRTGSSVSPPALDFRELARILPAGRWPRPVCLMVDEIQNVEPGAKNVLTRLHQGTHGLPIVPVLAGLGSSAEALQRCGLSRLSVGSVRDIGALAPAEAREAAERMLEAYRVDRRGGDRDWPGWLAGISEGWPQHLHNGMRALATALADAGGRLAELDAGHVERIEVEFRTESYRGRISPEMDSARQLLASVLGALPGTGGWPRDVLEREIARHGRPRGPDTRPDQMSFHLPSGMRDSTDFLDHLVHKGVFQLGLDHRSGCPIPSLRHYLVRYGRDPEPASEASPEDGGDALPGPTPFDDPFQV